MNSEEDVTDALLGNQSDTEPDVFLVIWRFTLVQDEDAFVLGRQSSQAGTSKRLSLVLKAAQPQQYMIDFYLSGRQLTSSPVLHKISCFVLFLLRRTYR